MVLECHGLVTWKNLTWSIARKYNEPDTIPAEKGRFDNVEVWGTFFFASTPGSEVLLTVPPILDLDL